MNEFDVLLESLQNNEKSYALPFPMAVFGTLRQGCGNHHLMAGYDKRIRAFLPNFSAQFISVSALENSTCPFEIYTYTPQRWNKMIGPVDRLEGFYPGKSDYGYNRTLAYLHILPDEFQHPLFPETGRPDLGGFRNLGIAKEQWDNFPKVPCWIYSSTSTNKKVGGYPVIWYNGQKQ